MGAEERDPLPPPEEWLTPEEVEALFPGAWLKFIYHASEDLAYLSTDDSAREDLLSTTTTSGAL